jgi:hypothetical protein
MSQNRSIKHLGIKCEIGDLGSFFENNHNFVGFVVDGFTIGQQGEQNIALAFGRVQHKAP